MKRFAASLPRPGAVLACLGLLLAPAAAAAFSIETAEFVVSVSDDRGNQRSVVADVVPYLPERACFGWRVRLVEPPALVRYREVLQLPEAPEYWGGEDDAYSPHVFSADRTRATTEEFVVPDEDGWVSNTWCIADGDPLGPHSIELTVEGEAVKRFDFEVKKISQ